MPSYGNTKTHFYIQIIMFNHPVNWAEVALLPHWIAEDIHADGAARFSDSVLVTNEWISKHTASSWDKQNVCLPNIVSTLPHIYVCCTLQRSRPKA